MKTTTTLALLGALASLSLVQAGDNLHDKKSNIMMAQGKHMKMIKRVGLEEASMAKRDGDVAPFGYDSCGTPRTKPVKKSSGASPSPSPSHHACPSKKYTPSQHPSASPTYTPAASAASSTSSDASDASSDDSTDPAEAEDTDSDDGSVSVAAAAGQGNAVTSYVDVTSTSTVTPSASESDSASATSTSSASVSVKKANGAAKVYASSSSEEWSSSSDSWTPSSSSEEWTSSSSEWVESTTASASASAKAKVQSVSVSSTGANKLGLAWDWQNPASGLANWAGASYIYTWSAYPPSGSMPDGMTWYPQYWGPGKQSDFESQVASGAISPGMTILGWNEPDQAGQANLGVDEGISEYKRLITPYASQGYTLATPGCTSDDNGFNWISNFISGCNGECGFSVVQTHYYGTDADEFIAYIEKIHNAFGLPIIVSEYAAETFGNGPDLDADETKAFLSKTQSFLNSADYVLAYMFFGAVASEAALGGVNPANLLITSTGALTDLGYQYLNSA